MMKWAFRGDDYRISKYYGNRESEDSEYISMPSGTPAGILKAVLIFLVGVLIVFLIWQGYAWYYNECFDRVMKFPYPLETMERLWEYLFEDRMMFMRSIYEHIAASMKRWLTAFLLSTFCGVLLGTVLGLCRKVYPVAMSPINIVQMIPGMAWLPVAMLMFGLSDESSILIIFIISFVIITINVAGGIRRIPEVYIRAADMMGAGLSVRVLKIVLPFAALDIVNGLRLGMGSAWRVLISAEMVISTGLGIGYAISALRSVLDYVGSFSCIAVICVIGLVIDKVVFVNIEKYVRHRLGMDSDV
ncbi:MAG: ABC transporter permease [Candidatus Methanomethylophilaceae archaeon]